MLEKFSTKNFKNFADVVLDFTASDYQFNNDSIKNGLVNNAIIYGENASGKSNIGFAIFDIVEHLTNKVSTSFAYKHYLKKPNTASIVEFEYRFKFGTDIVVYEYSKLDHDKLSDEHLSINNKEFLSVQRSSDKDVCFALKGSEGLSQDISKSGISIIQYVKNNALLEDNSTNKIFFKFYEFVQKMLFFRSLNENMFLGLESGAANLDEDIISKGNVENFESFLNEAGVACKLKAIQGISNKELVFDFKGEYIRFFDIASQGTKALILFYYWYQRIQSEQTSFIFIDEFDAFYHHSLSKFIVQKLKQTDAQVIFTTHNTSIMSNDLLRPDCYFLLKEGQINAINKLTDKELRKAHNLEKLYKSSLFA
ncbi:MAG: AAA family ATPase [Methylococcales symbiont of Iophon sp. n. MRB-2018]|nr:MAG: AAA family ATPase [Methylococcales symbiont of Iophon sp. n. MRB-2018]KAF3980332.1 MAG: AAA family ATPase [Methylococcales symbiont of Iophon sp. n. MRB-2018]